MDGAFVFFNFIINFFWLELFEWSYWDIFMIDLKWIIGLNLWCIFLWSCCDGLIDYLSSLLEAVVFVVEHILVEIFVDDGEVLELLCFQVALFYVAAVIEFSHVLDHCDQIILVLLHWLIFIEMREVFLVPVLKFILILIHFEDQAFEDLMLLLRGYWRF